jgi:hypothetical protein
MGEFMVEVNVLVSYQYNIFENLIPDKHPVLGT